MIKGHNQDVLYDAKAKSVLAVEELGTSSLHAPTQRRSTVGHEHKVRTLIAHQRRGLEDCGLP